MPEFYIGPIPVQDPQPDWIGFKQVFVVWLDKALWVLRQRNRVWDPWVSLGGTVGGVVIDRFRGSPLVVFTEQPDGNFASLKLGDAAGWRSLGKPTAEFGYFFAPGHAVLPTGEHLELYALRQRLFRRIQKPNGWTGWAHFSEPAGGPFRSLAVGRVPAGNLAVFVVDAGGSLWMKDGTAPWTNLGAGEGDPAHLVRTSIDWTTLSLIVSTVGDSGMLRYQVFTSSGISGWRKIDRGMPEGQRGPLPAFFSRSVCVATTAGVFVSTSTDWSSAGWSAWTALGLPDAHRVEGVSLALDSEEDNTMPPGPGLQVFAGTASRALWTRVQSGGDGSWGAWQSLGAPPVPPHPPRPRPGG